MNDYIILLWYTFFVQFETITYLLKSTLYPHLYDYNLFDYTYTWIHNDTTADLPVWLFLITGIVWDILIIYLVRKTIPKQYNLLDA